MSVRMWTRILAVAVVLALAMPAVAGPVRATISLADGVKLGGTELKAGTYNVEATDNKVMFKRGSKVVAEAAVKWVETQSKADRTTVVILDGAIKEIRFSGQAKNAVVE